MFSFKLCCNLICFTSCNKTIYFASRLFTATFESNVNFYNFFLNILLQRAVTLEASAASKVLHRTAFNLSRKEYALKEYLFLMSENLTLCTFCTMQICKSLRTSMAVHTYADRIRPNWSDFFVFRENVFL